MFSRLIGRRLLVLSVAGALVVLIVAKLYAQRTEQELGERAHWTLVSSATTTTKMNLQTGESFVLETFAEGKYYYWRPLSERSSWQAYYSTQLVKSVFSATACEVVVDSNGVAMGVKLKDAFEGHGTGLASGDLITKVGGRAVRSLPDLCWQILDENSIGAVEVTLVRADKEMTIKLWPRLFIAN